MEQAEKLAIQAKHGLTLEMTGDMLVKGRKAMETLVASLSAQTETTAKQTADIIKKAADDESHKMLAKNWAASVIENLTECFETAPELSSAFFEALKEVVSPYVKDERDYYALVEVRTNRPVKASNTDAKAEYEVVKAFVLSMFGLLEPLGMVPTDGTFPTKVNKAGTTVAEIPTLPKGGGSKDGRAAKTRKVRWNIDGRDLPSDTIPQDVLRVLYSPTERKGKTQNGLFDLFPPELTKAGQSFEREINGFKVTAWTPKDDGTDDDDNDSDENETEDESAE